MLWNIGIETYAGLSRIDMIESAYSMDVSPRRMLKKAVQQGRRRSKNWKHTLWGMLRILAS
jgi:hypothetical protein